MSGVTVRSSIFGGESSIEWHDPEQPLLAYLDVGLLAEAIHTVFCKQNRPMHGHKVGDPPVRLHSADAIAAEYARLVSGDDTE